MARNSERTESVALDGYKIARTAALLNEHQLISETLQECDVLLQDDNEKEILLLTCMSEFPYKRAGNAMEAELVLPHRLAEAILERLKGLDQSGQRVATGLDLERKTILGIILSGLLDFVLERLPSRSPQLSSGVIDWWLQSDTDYRYNVGWEWIMGLLRDFASQTDQEDILKRLIAGYRQFLLGWQDTKDAHLVIKELDQIRSKAPVSFLPTGEAWSEAARKAIEAGAGTDQMAWRKLMEHAANSNAGSPSAKWMRAAEDCLKTIGMPALKAALTEWFSLADKPRVCRALDEQQWQLRCLDAFLWSNLDVISPGRSSEYLPIDIIRMSRELAAKSGAPWNWLQAFSGHLEIYQAYGGRPPTPAVPQEPPPYDAIEDKLLTEQSICILRGLAWVAGLLPSPEMARALTALALSAYRKVPGKGPRAVRVGNACITALSMIGGLDAVGQLAVLKVKVKFGTAQAQIEKALTACAAKSGIPRDQLEEMSVPAYGLTEVGRGVESLGDHAAELQVRGLHDVALVWRGPDGMEKKSLPAAVKAAHKDELKELTAAKKDIERMLPAQAERLDSLFLAQKSWALEFWLEHYLQHPLVGVLARRLIWNFTTGGVTTPGIWLDDKLVDRTGAPVPLDAVQTRVTLWHPLDQPAEEVLGWRGFLEDHQIRQPFKQAHREIYLLTPAEAETVHYSNRFAAHVLRQHQFNALCAARGWRNKLRLIWDNDYPPATRLLPQWNLRAEFWIEGAGEETNDASVFTHVATDQVRFYRMDAEQAQAHASGGGYRGGGYRGGGYRGGGEPLRLADVPPLVFSEIMRDVDLFVGVASVGNDAAWRDGGRRQQFGAQWQHFAFGELTATAQTRRDVLQRLIPKMKIAAQCSFEDKFLVVRGRLHTYKIHLGSGNILRSPNDQYLCIVPARGKAAADTAFLPFEGDDVLSVILSKALLLAADDKITDPAITRQL